MNPNATRSSRQAKNDLEAMIDQFTYGQVLIFLSEIAQDKAEHLRANWQDSVSAKNWDSASEKTANLAKRVSV